MGITVGTLCATFRDELQQQDIENNTLVIRLAISNFSTRTQPFYCKDYVGWT